ncbi:DNA replication and repair protein RecF, partial [Streptococcus suis]
MELHKGLYVFLVDNDHVKTNILVSIYVLALTRIHLTRTDKDLLQIKEQELYISGLLHRTSRKVPLDIHLTEQGRVN